MSLYIQAAGLSILLALAIRSDLATRRIPNRLIVAGIASGLLCAIWAGATAPPSSIPSPGAAVLGMLSGFALFVPFHLLRVLGAGDVKLMAAVGVWLGPAATMQAALYVVLAGGVLALLTAWWSRTLVRVLRNVRGMLLHRTAPAVTGGQASSTADRLTGRLPYAVAIGAGTAVQWAVMFMAQLR